MAGKKKTMVTRKGGSVTVGEEKAPKETTEKPKVKSNVKAS